MMNSHKKIRNEQGIYERYQFSKLSEIFYFKDKH